MPIYGGKRMKMGAYLVLLLCGSYLQAGEHSLGAHEHGSVKMAIAVEKNVMDIDLDGPAESFLGFEHAPKNDKEKKLFGEVKNRWEKSLFTLIQPAQNLNCKITESSFNQIIEGSHADVEAKAKITCAKDMTGSDLQISFLKSFPKIKKLKVDIISSNTTTVDITKATQVLKL